MKQYKVLVSDPLAEEGIAILKERCEVEIGIGYSYEELKKAISSCHGLIVRSETKVTPELIESAPLLRVIGRAGVGVDNISLDAATRKGIVVINVPDGNSVSAAEHTLCLLLAASRKLVAASISLKEGKWERSSFTGNQIFHKTLGIIGYGRIGKLVAEYGKGMKMRVIAFDPHVSSAVTDQIGVEMVSFQELLSQSDYVSIHASLSDRTRSLIGDKELSMMKKSAILVNCARGGIVDEKALYRALVTGKIAGAALDVFEEEPAIDNPLLRLPSVTATPHLAASTREAQVNVAIACARYLLSSLEGEMVDSAVNLPSVERSFLQKYGSFLSLAERLGSLQGQLASGVVSEVNISCAGDLGLQESPLLTAAVLKGILENVSSDTVSYVNAGILARERGISVTQTREDRHPNFGELITVTIRSNGLTRSVAGTVFEGVGEKIVLIDGVMLNADPFGHLLIVYNEDTPGVVGMLGTVLEKYRVNIAGIYLGRQRTGGKAVSIINIDSEVSSEALQIMKQDPRVTEVIPVKL